MRFTVSLESELLADIDRCLTEGRFATRSEAVARHYGAPVLAGPDGVERKVTDADEAPVRAFLRGHLPSVGPRSGASVCLSTLTPARHFVIDLHPGSPGVLLRRASPGGFKSCPVVGEVLADLALEGKMRWKGRCAGPWAVRRDQARAGLTLAGESSTKSSPS